MLLRPLAYLLSPFFTEVPAGLNWIGNYTGERGRPPRSAELTLLVIKIMRITRALPNNPERQESHSPWLKQPARGRRSEDYVLGLASGSVWLDLVVQKSKEGRKETVIEREQSLWETGNRLVSPACVPPQIAMNVAPLIRGWLAMPHSNFQSWTPLFQKRKYLSEPSLPGSHITIQGNTLGFCVRAEQWMFSRKFSSILLLLFIYKTIKISHLFFVMLKEKIRLHPLFC